MSRPKDGSIRVSHGSDRYDLLVFPTAGRWLWYVTLSGATSSAKASSGRLLGCGESPDEADAWKQAKIVMRASRKSA
ncbi:MAG TPA: hypothetical protein VJT32_05700 [bacterium]|nr:hypothetical protein [bacterium]